VRSGGLGAAVVIMPSAFGIGSDLEAQMGRDGSPRYPRPLAYSTPLELWSAS
jgi:hypothetical protein